MQTQLEVKGIKKRTTDTLANSTKVFGVSGNQVKGHSQEDGDEYDINGANARKGGKSTGSLVNHLNKSFDLTTGGDAMDITAREKQQGYVIPGQVTYTSDSYYSDIDDIKIDTSKNIGQVIIY